METYLHLDQYSWIHLHVYKYICERETERERERERERDTGLLQRSAILDTHTHSLFQSTRDTPTIPLVHNVTEFPECALSPPRCECVSERVCVRARASVCVFTHCRDNLRMMRGPTGAVQPAARPREILGQRGLRCIPNSCVAPCDECVCMCVCVCVRVRV